MLDVASFTVPLGDSAEQEQEHVPHEQEQELALEPAIRLACCSAEISCILFNLNSFIAVEVLKLITS